MIENKDLPSFFSDSSNSDKCEEVIDYYISWTLRCAQKDFENLTVCQYSKKILSKCIFNDSEKLDKICVTSVKTWKQSDRIDLWAEVELNSGDKYALIFENKMYSSIRNNQLLEYKKHAENYYKNTIEKQDYKLIFLFLRCADNFHEQDNDICKRDGFIPLLLEDLKKAIGTNKISKNDLFDEFWFYWWDADYIK